MEEWLSKKLLKLNKELEETKKEITETLAKCRELREKENSIKKEIGVCWAIEHKTKK